MLRGELARVGKRVDRVDVFVAADRFDPREPQCESARVPIARLNRVKGDFEDDLWFDFTITAVIGDRVLFEMLG